MLPKDYDVPTEEFSAEASMLPMPLMVAKEEIPKMER
jgi:hypothetical protein